MSDNKVAISYSDLEKASELAYDVAERIDEYADELYSKVKKKISDYNGPWTNNMSRAYDFIDKKIDALRERSDAFEEFSEDLDDLLDECQHTDNSVANKVRRLTGRFARRNGIEYTAADMYIIEMVYKSSTSAEDRRYLYENQRDYIYDQYEDIKDDIHYYYEGGKEHKKSFWDHVKTIAGDVVDIVISAVAVFCFGDMLAIKDLVASVMTLGEDIHDIYYDKKNEDLAYELCQDPENAALAYRLRNIDSYEDYLRYGNILDENDETEFNRDYKGRREKLINHMKWRTGFETVTTLLGVLDIFSIGGSAVKASKYLRGTAADSRTWSSFFEAMKYKKGGWEFGFGIINDIRFFGEYLYGGFTEGDWNPLSYNNELQELISMDKKIASRDKMIQDLKSYNAEDYATKLKIPSFKLPTIKIPGITSNPKIHIPTPPTIKVPGCPQFPPYNWPEGLTPAPLLPAPSGGMPDGLTPAPLLPAPSGGLPDGWEPVSMPKYSSRFKIPSYYHLPEIREKDFIFPNNFRPLHSC